MRAISTPSEASTPAFVITPVGRVDLKLSLVRGATLDPDGRREPPAGGAFVVIEATGLPEPRPSTPLLVSTGGKEYPVSVSAPRMAVAVSTDGRDARVGVGYDGLGQWIDVASGKRVGHIPRGYYDTIAGTSYRPLEIYRESSTGPNGPTGTLRSSTCRPGRRP